MIQRSLGFDIKNVVSRPQTLPKPTCPKPPQFRDQKLSVINTTDIASYCLPGKTRSLGACKRPARLEGYTLLASNDPTS